MRKPMAKKRAHLVPVHPGEILREEIMAPLQLSVNGLARALRVPATRIGHIVCERRAITADTALRLGRYFGTSAELWINMQAHYDLEVARDRLEARINRTVQQRKAA
jgi:addiction module HigA family antidote